MKITEINIVPVKPRDGLVAFASIVLDHSLYLGSIAVYTRPNGSYRLLYPTKTVGDRPINLFHPINKETSKQIEDSVFKKCDEVFENDNRQYPQFFK